MTASMDVDSDDDDEIIAERGTIACILIFSRRARAYVLLFLSFHHIRNRRRRKERRRSLRAKTTDNTTGRIVKFERSSELERTLRIISDGFVRKAASRLSSWLPLLRRPLIRRKRKKERRRRRKNLSFVFRCWLSIVNDVNETKKKKKGKFVVFSSLSLNFCSWKTSSCFYHRANDRHHHQSSSKLTYLCYVHSHKHSSEMAKPERETVLGQEEVWVHGTEKRTDAAGTRKENLERPRRHVFEKVSVG